MAKNQADRPRILPAFRSLSVLCSFYFVSIALFEKQGFHWIGATIGIVSFVVYCLVWHVTGYRKFAEVLQSSWYSLASFMFLLLLVLAVIQQVDPHMHAWEVALF